jgi:transposase-like protein
LSYRFVETGVLVRLHPDEARQRILLAYTHAGGAVQGAADELQVTTRTLLRWVGALGIEPSVRRIRKLWLLRRAKPAKMGATKVRAAGAVAARKAMQR